jgi:DNA-binding GntR family transcriptional regulator
MSTTQGLALPPTTLPRPRRRARRAKARGGLNAWLTTRILEYLRELGLAPGVHITEQQLADHFQVSRTPIRLALAALAKSGAVEHRPNRGYYVAAPPTAIAQAEVAEPDEDQLYYRIADDRLKGVIPARVTEAELVRRYRASRARVATVLSRMAHEGWLERLPGHGWAFEPMLDSVKAYEDGYRFRAVIEPAALRHPGYHLAPEAIARLRQQQQDLLDNDARYSDVELFELGTRFHEVIVGGSGNPFLLDAIRRINALRRLLEYRAKRSRDKIARQFREHLQLLDLIEKGKLEQAARHMEKHLDVARKTKAPLVASKNGK